MRVPKAADMSGVAHGVGATHVQSKQLGRRAPSVSAENRNARHILGAREVCHLQECSDRSDNASMSMR